MKIKDLIADLKKLPNRDAEIMFGIKDQHSSDTYDGEIELGKIQWGHDGGYIQINAVLHDDYMIEYEGNING